MKLILEINNKTPQKISKRTFLGVFRYTLEMSGYDFLKDKEIELSVALVGLDEMHDINKQYRQKNKPTDVLSFGDFDKKELIIGEAQRSKEIFLGEIILCPEYISKNALEDGETFEYALNYITSHGILHLLGFEHGKKMFTLQRQVANMVK